MNPRLSTTLACCLALCLSARFDRAQGADESSLAGKVLVLAAASTTDAVEAIRGKFTAVHPGVVVRASFAASSALARQIEAGAPGDVYLSAAEEWADYVEQEKLVAARRDLLGNRLVVIVPADSKLTIDKPEDLLKRDVRRLALADPTAVPAGVYAREALEKLGLWNDLRSRVAGAADVRQALQFVETGAADAGIVYATDATVDPKVRVVVELAAELSEPIRYPLVLLKRAEDNRAAVAFYEFLASPAAAEVFQRYGFVVLGGDAAGQAVEEEPCGR